MTSDALRELADALDEYDEGAVTRIESVKEPGSNGVAAVTAEVELPLSLGRSHGEATALTPRETVVDSDGRLQLCFESAAPVVPVDPPIEPIEPIETAVDRGEIAVTLRTTVEIGSRSGEKPGGRRVAHGDTQEITETPPGSDGGGPRVDERRDATSSPGGADDPPRSPRSDDVPPFRDPDLLAEVYETCDTFAEMTEALGMDVTAETVRRYMIDYDIHQPQSYATRSRDEAAADAGDVDVEAQPPLALPDGMGLPDDVTIDSFIETVQRSNTIYEVTKDIDIDRQEALDALQELNLLDLVVGRLATETKRDIKREEIIDRLREASAKRERDAPADD